MMNPDITDPAWIARRELLWPRIEQMWSEEGTRRDMKVLRRVFFTGYFDLNDKDCSWFNKKEDLMKEFDYYPVQTTEFWCHYFGEQAKERYLLAPDSNWRRYNPVKMATHFVSFVGDKTMFGWDVQTEVELHHFFHGKEYVPGVLNLLGFEGQNTGFDPPYIVNKWSRYIVRWLLCGLSLPQDMPGEDNKWLHLKSYFLSCLRYLDDKFHGDISWIDKAVAVDRDVVEWFQRLLYQVYHFNEEVRVASLCLQGVEENQALEKVGRRKQYLQALQRDIEQIEGKPSLHALLERAQKADFKPAFSDKSYLMIVNSVGGK